MAGIERKSGIRKAPDTDIVTALTQPAPELPSPTLEKQPVSARIPAPTAPSRGGVDDTAEPVFRPRVGRPRSKRRMEPFSTKMEIGLRDEVDTYVTTNGMTIVDFLDEAVRDLLKKKHE